MSRGGQTDTQTDHQADRLTDRPCVCQDSAQRPYRSAERRRHRCSSSWTGGLRLEQTDTHSEERRLGVIDHVSGLFPGRKKKKKGKNRISAPQFSHLFAPQIKAQVNTLNEVRESGGAHPSAEECMACSGAPGVHHSHSRPAPHSSPTD